MTVTRPLCLSCSLSDGRLPRAAPVGAGGGVGGVPLPVPDPRPARAHHQLGEGWRGGGHRGGEVQSFNPNLSVSYRGTCNPTELSLCHIGVPVIQPKSHCVI